MEKKAKIIATLGPSIFSQNKLKKLIDLGVDSFRINFSHNTTGINKIISSSNHEGLKKIEKIYKNITSKKIIKVSNIKIAESAKIIENIQRDINIALINELSQIFNLLDINTNEVLDAACTKWNFHNFRDFYIMSKFSRNFSHMC